MVSNRFNTIQRRVGACSINTLTLFLVPGQPSSLNFGFKDFRDFFLQRRTAKVILLSIREVQIAVKKVEIFVFLWHQ